ncbi:MAG: glycosyltransferase [Bdellovibrionales bacterium]|nr:glycosyltransferase [Bdellovibrionales bacterium]
MRPYFSVVIPLYNKESYIQRAVHSVLSQDFENFELLLIDDGSTDGSVDSISSLEDCRIRIIRQEHKGASAARNKGIEESLADYVAFLDADDEWKSSHLENISNLIESYPDVLLFSTNYELQLSKTSIVPSNLPFLEETGLVSDFFYWTAFGDCPANASSSCLHKDCFRRAGVFPDDSPYAEDLDMWIRVASHGYFAIHETPSVVIHKEAIGRATRSQTPLPGELLPIERTIAELRDRGKADDAYLHAILNKTLLGRAKNAVWSKDSKAIKYWAHKVVPRNVHDHVRKRVMLGISWLPKILQAGLLRIILLLNKSGVSF